MNSNIAACLLSSKLVDSPLKLGCSEVGNQLRPPAHLSGPALHLRQSHAY
jgi:hypothetical protein